MDLSKFQNLKANQFFRGDFTPGDILTDTFSFNGHKGEL